MRLVSSVLLVAAIAACSGSADTAPVIGDLNGNWAEPASVPGNRFDMALMANGSKVTGSGNACGEAAQCVAFTVTGTVVGPEVQLHMDFAAGFTEDFNGAFKTPTLLTGTASRSDVPGQTFTTSFRKF